MSQVMFPMRTFGVLGVKNVILTNAAGSTRTSNKQGTLMLIRDHINLMGINPLRGANDERFGPRFPDLTQVYDIEFQQIADQAAKEIMQERVKQGIEAKIRQILRRGVYCALSGPTYETPAEIRMYRMIGADAVGMSTVPEAIAARHSGMRVIGISCLTNMAAGMTDEVINHEEVMETGAKVADIFKELLKRVITKINEGATR
jgi:purine-nucleoside phosphorylase